MALFDIYEITDKSVFFGQEVDNIYFYQQTSAVDAPDAADVAAAYIGQVLPDVCDIQNVEVLHTEIIVRNLFNVSDNAVVSISEPGTGSGAADLFPVFNAVGFKLNQDNGAVKNGAKRYAGCPEANATDGVIDSAGFITTLDALGDTLDDVLLHGIIPTFVPVVVKRLLSGSDYVLPDNLGDAVFGTIVEAVWNTLITSQNSRKIGVGS